MSGHFKRLHSAAQAQLTIRVYGSWMWQTLNGEAHGHAGSDLDVLVDVADVAAATAPSPSSPPSSPSCRSDSTASSRSPASAR